MKRIISWILSMCMVLTMLAAVAPESQALPIRFHEIDMPRQTNPLYDDVVDLDRLPAYEKPAGGDFGTSATNPTYAESYMTAKEAEAYMREAMKDRENVISLSFTHSNRYDINLIVESLVYSAMLHTGVSTEGDYLMWTWSTWEVVDGSYYSQGYNYYITIEYYVTYYTTASQEAEMDVAVNDLLAQLNLYDATDFAKIKGIYDYLCANVTYDFDNLYDEDYLLKFTAYAALMHGTAVCQGYAVLFYRLALELGVDNRVVVGWQTSSGGSHAWNIAQLGKYYYNLDATWDAGYEEYDFFLTNEENFYDHTRDPEYDTSSFHSDYPMGTENYLDNTVGTLPSGIVWAVDPWMGILYFAGSGEVDELDYTLQGKPWVKFAHDISHAVVGEGITALGVNMFRYCEDLQTVQLPESLVEIKEYAFNQSGLREISFPSNLKRIGYGAFSYSKLTNVVIPEGLEELGSSAFSCCYELKSIVFPRDMTLIPDSVCYNCYNLTDVTLPEGVTRIDINAFAACSKLPSIQLPSALESIGFSSFSGCDSMTELWIPASVTSIEAYSLCDMDSLNAVYFLGDAPSFGAWVFNNIPGTVYYPRNNATWTEAARTIECSSPTWAPYDAPLAVSKQPKNVVAHVGEQVQFTTAANQANATFQWQWRPNEYTAWANTAAEGNQTATLTVPVTADRNGFQYRCVISDGKGNVCYTSVAKLTVNPGPAITMQPTNQTANAGGTAKFTVAATGNGLTYQWQWRPNATTAWANAAAEGNKTATLTVPATLDRNGYEYRCKITDSQGGITYSNAAKLTVVSGPKITTQPANQTAAKGETAKFTVAATGNGLTYQWEWRPNASAAWANTAAEGNQTATLSVPVTADRNGYEYRCKITDNKGNVSYSNAAKLTVKAGPTITSQPANQTANTGSAAKFTVAANGNGLTYQWQWRPNAATAWANAAADGNKTATLTVPATLDRNGYEYRCKITDSQGGVTYSNVAKLTVKAGPTITSQPTNQTANAGGTAKFTVKATGNGLTYQWQWRPNASTAWANAGADGNKTATLTVPGTMDRNGYEYRCKITDSAGNAVYTNVVKLTVKSVITVTTQPVNQTVNTGGAAKFTVKAKGSGLSYQWEWRPNASTAWANAGADGNKTATLTVPATKDRNGLQYRCKITDQYGTVIYTSVVTLTVKTGPAITAQPTGQTANVGGKAVFKVTATGNGLTYQWQWRPNASTAWANAGADGNKTATLTVPATMDRNGYEYRCKITDAGGNVVYTNAAKLTVKTGITITAQPTAQTAIAGQNAKFTVTATGEGLTYQWEWRSGNGAWANAGADGNKTATLTVPATMDRNGLEYRCKITDKYGNVVYTNTVVLEVN